MRRRFAQIVIFTAACLLADKPNVLAQSAVPEIQGERSCPTSSASADEQPSDPEVLIVEVTFRGSLQLPTSDQDQIAASIKQRTYGNSDDGLTDELLERVRVGWQDRGYFNVHVSGDARMLTSSPDSQHLTLSVHVDEGPQYSLGEITFTNNRAISDIRALRGLFPINNGDIASREKIATGLENLRKAYGDRGYINFTSVPNTTFDDEKKLLSLNIDVDEGKVFRMGDVNILGFDEPTRHKLLKEFPMKRGQIYDGRLLDSFLLRHSSMFSPEEPSRTSRRLDERAGTVAITFYAPPCPD